MKVGLTLHRNQLYLSGHIMLQKQSMSQLVDGNLTAAETYEIPAGRSPFQVMNAPAGELNRM
jgi:hypothetical protein